MKVVRKIPDYQTKREGLTNKQLRAIEQELGIYLDNPVFLREVYNQAFGVFDEEETYVDDIFSGGTYFSNEELRAKIFELFKQTKQ